MLIAVPKLKGVKGQKGRQQLVEKEQDDRAKVS
jgi:hypothetical protein